MPSKKETQGPAKDQQKAAGDEPDGSRQFAKADHQARQDYQRDGEPFGPLDNRDLSEKEDVPGKESRDSENSDESTANAAESSQSPETRSDEEETPLDEAETSDEADGESVEADNASEDATADDDAGDANES